MAQEIEKKYLILTDEWRGLPHDFSAEITQGYIPEQESKVKIVFPKADHAQITISAMQKTVVFDVTGSDVEEDFAKVTALPEFDKASNTLSLSPSTICRFRSRALTKNDQPTEYEAFLTIKAPSDHPEVVNEFELSVDFEHAQKVLREMSVFQVDKTRFGVPYEGNLWEVDLFKGELKGLEMAELEAPSLQIFETAKLIPGLGTDVTSDRRYTNRALGEFGIPKL